MMTLEEIRSAQINPTVAREAYSQADRCLMDVLETKKSFEQKSFTLFGSYVTAATALVRIGGAILKDNYWNCLSTPLFTATSIFVIGAIFFILALMDKTYGALASDPDMWLNKSTIDGDDSAVPIILLNLPYPAVAVGWDGLLRQWLLRGLRLTGTCQIIASLAAIAASCPSRSARFSRLAARH
jgi:hypothetical protein